MPKKNNNIRMPCDENERFAIKPSIIYAPRIKPLTRAKKVEIHEVKANLKVQLPALTPTGVRRYRVPHHETVLLELKEAGFQEAEDYFKQLYEHEAKSINLETKRLKEQRHLIERIKYGLVNAELAKRANKPMEQTIQMLETALFFQSLMPEWFWIADKLFQSALKISTEIVEDDGEMLNIVKYIYGTFLFHKVKDARSAFTLLDEARKASEGKRWNASKILKAKQWPLFQESNLILNEVLIALAEQSKDEDPNLAVKILIDAIERASDSGDEEHLAKALYEAAKMQLSADNISEALQNFSKYLAIVETIPDPNGVCNGYKELASVYKVLKDVEGVKRHLVSFKEHAEKSGLAARLADAHYCLGEFELEQVNDKALIALPPFIKITLQCLKYSHNNCSKIVGRPSSATPHLTFAFESYKKLEMVKEMDKARFLAGVSKGEELKTSYLAMIEKCKENDAEAFRKLLEWTHRRTPFWTL